MRGTIRRALAAVVGVGAVALAAAAPAQAGVLSADATGCSDSASSRVFLPWLDLASYFPAPGGDAESAEGWTLSGGAGIVAGNEPWKVGGRGDSHALALPARSQATTGGVCVGL